ncbi:hypothetical protein GIX45_13925 [Erwinia sp. CPCC 100877]|nr:hypothetical protein [Erwinia sp. CPCC 100877]
MRFALTCYLTRSDAVGNEQQQIFNDSLFLFTVLRRKFNLEPDDKIHGINEPELFISYYHP